MGNFRTIDIVGRAMGQYQESTKNLMAIGNARRRLAQEQEDREFKKREAELNLEKAKREGSMSSLEYDILSTQHKEYLKQQSKIADGAEAMINMEEHKNKKAADQAMTATGKMFQQDPEGTAAAMAVVRGVPQRTEIRPKFAYGKVGYETVDLEQEKEKAVKTATVKRGYTDKDILSEAQKMADDDSEEGLTRADKVRKYIPEAKRMFEEVAGSEGTKSISPQGSDMGGGETKQFRNKKTGKTDTFKRDRSGKWVKI